MSIGGKLRWSLVRVRRPQPTVRWRLTLLYAVLFLVCGVALLAITYALVSRFRIAPSPPLQVLQGQEPSREVRTLVGGQRAADLRDLLLESGIALGIMTVVSGVLGWVVAGRVLAPVRRITETAERISDTNLHERLALPGPRDELRLLADTIDRLLERLQVAFDAQRLFVANASHELRTPLAMMRTTLDVALTAPEGVVPQVKILDADLREDIDHADRLLESFLVLARAQHGELGEQHQVALEQLITTALAARSRELATKDLDVHTSLSPVRTTGSETLLTRMIENVIENAVRHNHAHGSIDIALGLDRDQARVIVEADGPLLDERRAAELAQPFRRLGQERTYSRTGHGLGLSIVAAVAAAHGGTLLLHARPQGGLRVEITLPRASAAHPAGVSP
jgi:signal transduction histidine kinase